MPVQINFDQIYVADRSDHSAKLCTRTFAFYSHKVFM